MKRYRTTRRFELPRCRILVLFFEWAAFAKICALRGNYMTVSLQAQPRFQEAGDAAIEHRAVAGVEFFF